MRRDIPAPSLSRRARRANASQDRPNWVNQRTLQWLSLLHAAPSSCADPIAHQSSEPALQARPHTVIRTIPQERGGGRG